MTFLVSCEHLEKYKLISKFEDLEGYRVWITEKSINKKDSVFHERKMFKAFDFKGRLINEGNFKFYFYKGNKDQIEKITTVLTRKWVVRIYTNQYVYNDKGLLQNILRVGKSNDTTQSFRYDEYGNLIESKSGYRTIAQEFEDGILKKRIKTEGGGEPRISEFEYDSLKRPIIENWVFSGDNRMKTRFEYYSDGKLFRETDSSYSHGESPNTIIEFRNEYKYDELDSISEIIHLGRVQSETTFYVRGRQTFERRLERKK